MHTPVQTNGPLGNDRTAMTLDPTFVEACRLEAVKVTKELRRDLDAQLQKLKAIPGSRERALSVTKLQEAIMWLGMDLKRLAEIDPYPSSRDPSSTKIEPTADGLKL